MTTGDKSTEIKLGADGSGGRDQKDVVQSQPRQIVRETILKKNLSQKRAGGVAQGVGPVLGEKKFVSFDTSHFMSVEVHYSFKINAIMEIVLRVHRYIMEYS
jgi:hypothetical protein